ncbi:MAG: hypothetical protein COV36_01265 [Alphaproteobacteria bacterium CG11_big_fil_rev_8_21_14_0_20_44_7]|nr:MAG: hypothetical protein COV36_01265 [Alphaproteobacteria bacterium CG11_big_fil_rev_8_21_14_0_20_44_7]
MQTEKIKKIAIEKRVHEQFWNVELDIAMQDLQNENYFSVVEKNSGPYDVKIDIVDGRLMLNVSYTNGAEKFMIPLKSFRNVIKDYFLVFDSYQEALNNGHHARLEAIDMGRRGLHNEGAEILIHLLEKKINIDLDTARRLFTIIMVLHLK